MSQSFAKRKEKLSLARVQMKLVALVCVHLVVACSGVSYLLTYFFLSSMRKSEVFQTDLAKSVIPTSVAISAIVLLILLGGCFVVAILVGHRIVGPMRRLATRLHTVAAGKFRKGFHMRVGDDLYFIGEALADLESRMIERVEELRASASRLEALLQEQPPGSAAELKAALAALRETLQKFDLGDETPAPSDTPAKAPAAT